MVNFVFISLSVFYTFSPFMLFLFSCRVLAPAMHILSKLATAQILSTSSIANLCGTRAKQPKNRSKSWLRSKILLLFNNFPRVDLYRFLHSLRKVITVGHTPKSVDRLTNENTELRYYVIKRKSKLLPTWEPAQSLSSNCQLLLGLFTSDKHQIEIYICVNIPTFLHVWFQFIN